MREKVLEFPSQGSRPVSALFSAVPNSAYFLTVMELASRTALDTPWQRGARGARGRSGSNPDPAASRLSPLVRGTMNPIFNKHFVPLTKGDSREAAGGQGFEPLLPRAASPWIGPGQE